MSQLLSTTLLSDYIWGQDIHQEFFTYLQVLGRGAWNPGTPGTINSVLSISILPAIVTLVSGVDGVRVFELVFPLVYSLVPVVLYKILRKIIPPEGAFLSVFLFMSYPAFAREIVGLGRQEIGELLLLLLIWVSLSFSAGLTRSREFAIVLLTVGFVTAHYTLAFVFLPILVFSFVAAHISRRIVALSTSTTLLLTFVMTFGWYVFVGGGAAVSSLTNAASYVISGVIQDFFNPSSRPLLVLQAVGVEPALTGALHLLSRGIQLLMPLFLVLGLFALTLKRQKSVTERRMLPLMGAGFIFLGAAVLLPYFASQLQITRIYHIALLFVSPCFAYGLGLFDSASRIVHPHIRRLARFRLRVSMKWILAAAILFSYFIFVSGWTWAVIMDRPDSVVLDAQRMRDSQDPGLKRFYFEHFTVLPDITGARWLSHYHRIDRSVCSDVVSRRLVLVSYGGFYFTSLSAYANISILPYCISSDSYVYLSEFNSLSGIAYSWGDVNAFSISHFNLLSRNLIYSAGSTAIYG